MDTILELDEKLKIFNITTRTSLHSSEHVGVAIVLGLIISALAAGGITSSVITLAIITRTYLVTSQIFRYVKLFATITIVYLIVSLVTYAMKLFDYNNLLSIILNLEPVLSFNLAVIISMLCLDRYVSKHLADCYFYVFFFWCIASVYIHDFSIIFQVGQSILHLITLIITIVKLAKYSSSRKRNSKEFSTFRLRVVAIYIFLWIMKNILLFLLCFVLPLDVVVVNTMISITLTCICCVVTTYMVYNCGYRYKIYFDQSKEFSFENPLENSLLYSSDSL